MNKLRVQALVVVLLMLGSLAGAAAWRPTTKLADMRPKLDLEALFPKAFAEWRVDDRMPVQLVSPDTAALLNKIYNQTLSRTYVNARGERIMLSVAYGGDQSDATRAHRPEVCYPAQGFQILSSRLGSMPMDKAEIRVKQLVAKLGSRVEPISYWIVVGEKVTTTGTEQKLAQLSYSTRGVVPDGLLIRVSTIDPDAKRSYEIQADFLRAMRLAIPSNWRANVFGTDV